MKQFSINKGLVNFPHRVETNKKAIMITIKNGRVFVKIEGEYKETSNPELIGLAILDFAETQPQDDIAMNLKSWPIASNYEKPKQAAANEFH